MSRERHHFSSRPQLEAPNFVSIIESACSGKADVCPISPFPSKVLAPLAKFYRGPNTPDPFLYSIPMSSFTSLPLHILYSYSWLPLLLQEVLLMFYSVSKLKSVNLGKLLILITISQLYITLVIVSGNIPFLSIITLFLSIKSDTFFGRSLSVS